MDERQNLKIICAFIIAFMFVIPTGATFFSDESYVSEPAANVIVEQPNTITIQPDATEGKDAWIGNEVTTYENSGADDEWYFGTGGMSPTDEHRALVQFAVPDVHGTVIDATVSLYANLNFNGGKINATVNPLTAEWDEGIGHDFSGEGGYVNWVNSTNTTTWATPGGDYDSNYESYLSIQETGTWYHWNITDIVNAWQTGALENHGLIFRGAPIGMATNYVGVFPSDGPSGLRPKLTISYGAEIDPPVPAQSFNEDDPGRTISLAGRGSGSVVKIAGPDNDTNGFPFSGNVYNQGHFQFVYRPEQVGAEGVINQIDFNRVNAFDTGTFSNIVISMAHTELDSLTTTYANNYDGYLIEVFNEPNVFMNASNEDSWVPFILNGNFTYDSSKNLLVDIKWDGDSGDSITIRTTSEAASTNEVRIWNWDNNAALTATSTDVDDLPNLRFTIDVMNNAVIDNGTAGSSSYPFQPGTSAEFHSQMLFNSSWINESGIIDILRFQCPTASPDWVVIENVSVRLAHSTNYTLENVFDAHNSDPWVQVLNVNSLNLSHTGGRQWVGIDVNNIFTYNGVDNLLIDIRYQGGYGADGIMNTEVFQPSNYDGFLYSNSLASATGSLYNRHYNIQMIFCESDDLTWSASTTDNDLIAVQLVNNNALIITPKIDAFGTGVVSLRLTNSDGIFTTQNIIVNVNAVNDAPEISTISDVNVVEDMPFVLNITNRLTDIDDPVENLTLKTNSPFVTVDGKELTFLYPEGWTHDNVTVTVTDGTGAMASRDVHVIISPVNDEPELIGFSGNFNCHANVAKVLNLNPDDEETPDNITIWADSSYVSVDGTDLTFLYPKGIGSEVVNIHVIDNEIYTHQNNVSYILNVTIFDHPDIVSHSPNGTDIPVTTTIAVTFDMAMNTNATENSFEMAFGGTEINGTFSWNSANTTMTFTPSDTLSNGIYDVMVGTGATSDTGHSLLNAYSWNFTAALGNYDGDQDGMPDQYELDNGLNPDLDDSTSDLDGDGLPNLYEYENDLDPATNDADLDSDGDGKTNLEEYEDETDPNDPDDVVNDILGGDSILLPLLIIIIVIVIVVALLLMKNRGKAEPAPPEEYTEPEYQETEPVYEEPPVEEEIYPPPPE